MAAAGKPGCLTESVLRDEARAREASRWCSLRIWARENLLTISPKVAERACPEWCVAATALVTRRAILEHSASDRWTVIVDGPDVITKLGVRSRMRKHRRLDGALLNGVSPRAELRYLARM